MSTISIVCGVVLILIGVAGYGYGQSSGNASITALIPAFFGVVLAVLGVVGGKIESLRKHVMHAAAAIALLGFILTAGRLVARLRDITLTPAVASQAAMALVCLVFVLLAIRSFREARRSR